MTRKHYQALAADIKREYCHLTSTQKIGARAMIELMCQSFKRANPDFDRYRFLEACDITEMD